jgi:hypothetical protein
MYLTNGGGQAIKIVFPLQISRKWNMNFKKMLTLAAALLVSTSVFAAGGKCHPAEGEPCEDGHTQVVEVVVVSGQPQVNSEAAPTAYWWWQAIGAAVDNYKPTCIPSNGVDTTWSDDNIKACVSDANGSIYDRFFIVRGVVYYFGQTVLTSICAAHISGQAAVGNVPTCRN